MKQFRTIALFACSVIFTHTAQSQSVKPSPKENTRQIQSLKPIARENSGVQHQEAANGPIVINWKMQKIDGTANLTVNPDGTYLFSGEVKDKKKNHDFDISMALKSSLGGIIVFHFSGNDTDGVQWSKQGKSPILKENFKTFTGKFDWGGEWRTPLSSKGLAKLYEEREARKEKLRKEEAEARRKHDAKVAKEKKEEREKVEQEDLAAAQAASQKQQSSGGGSDVGTDILNGISTVGSAISTIASVGSTVAGLF